MQSAQRDRPPNIVFILADDLGYGDLGCYGQRMFATPNIDRLASEGIRFSQAYAGAAVCAPSRCCLMTGFHTGHARIRENRGRHGRVPLRREDLTVAEVLQGAGYRTGLIGKWGLGEAGTSGIPNEKGFDEFFGFLNQDHALEYYPTHLWDNRTEWFPPGNQGAKRKQYVQDLFTERALRFVRENADGPFFLYLAYTIPHASSELGRDTGDGFVVPSYEPYADRNWPRPEKGFAAMMHRLDHDVGRLAQELDRLGLGSNTLLIFTSDNGPAADGGHTPEFFQSSAGLRGKKGDLYEGGIRVPFIARWPGRIAPASVSNEVIAFWDFLPTAAELAGAPFPANLDGRSFRLTLAGSAPRQGAQMRPDPLYWESPKGGGLLQAARLGDWKAIRTADGTGLELYDLSRDRGERENVASSHPSVVNRMREILRESHHVNDDYPSKTPEA
jgi:arylsulfatase A-like enzyme